MTPDQFWNIIEKVHQASKGDMDKKCKLLDTELRQLPLSEVRSLSENFQACLDRAYSHELWAAAFIIGGGCSDDSFWDFRSTLVSMGRKTFEQTLADPESLAELDYDADSAFYEGYQYVPGKVALALNNGQSFPRSHPQPKKTPSGKRWDEKTVAQLYPKLAKKYGYND